MDELPDAIPYVWTGLHELDDGVWDKYVKILKYFFISHFMLHWNNSVHSEVSSVGGPMAPMLHILTGLKEKVKISQNNVWHSYIWKELKVI